MAGSTRRQVTILVALLAVLAAVLIYNYGPQAATTLTSGSAAPARSAPALSSGAVEDVRLALLERERPVPRDAARNPFRFRERAPSASSGVGEGGGPRGFGGAPVAPAGPTPLAGPPPIPLKFIGIVQPASSGKLAVLSDGRNVFYGREGDTIEGRYRIVRIGVESIEMAYVGGDDRQVIRLSGS